MARKFSKISQKAFESMQINAGVVLNKFDPTGTTEIQDADIICATSGGVTAECKPNITDLGDDVDNAQKNTAELMQIEDYDCTLAFTALNATTDVIKLALGAADVAEKKVTPRMTLDPTESTGDFKDIWWVGDTIDGGFVAVRLMNALSTGGLTLKTTDKGKGNISVTLTGCPRLGSDTVPMEWYYSPKAAA
nr:MAG TPA: major tail protein [Caudoviricetes sp.]